MPIDADDLCLSPSHRNIVRIATVNCTLHDSLEHLITWWRDNNPREDGTLAALRENERQVRAARYSQSSSVSPMATLLGHISHLEMEGAPHQCEIDHAKVLRLLCERQNLHLAYCAGLEAGRLQAQEEAETEVSTTETPTLYTTIDEKGVEIMNWITQGGRSIRVERGAG